MTAHGIPAVKLPRKKANTSNSFLEIPPFAMMMPDKTNIGTASRGKESSPPNMARIRYLAPTVKDGSKTEGRTEAIPRVIDTGIAMTSSTTKITNKRAAGISVPPFRMVCLPR